MEEALTEGTQRASDHRGGLKTMPFIIANEAFEKVASYGLMPNMILYLMNEYNMDITTGTSVLSLWSAATNFLPIVEAFISDSVLGRYLIIALGSISSVLGMILLWLTTMIPEAKPPHCVQSSKLCKSATPAQLALLYFSFMLISIGAGGIRSSSLAFGANQLHKGENPNSNKKALQSFFNWYFVTSSVSVLLSMSVIVYIQDHLGWKVGFGVPVVLMFLSAFMFLLASSFYVKMKVNKSLFTGFAQVIVAAFRKGGPFMPHESSHACYHHSDESKIVSPTQNLRFLNRACTITNQEKDLKPDGTPTNPWSLCTSEQVEELKSVLKVIPIWSTGIILSVTVNQSFPVLLAKTMDRHVTSNFQIPAGSFGTFTVGSLIIWIVIYDCLLRPQLAKLTGKPYGLGVKQRMGIGLVLSCLAMAHYKKLAF